MSILSDYRAQLDKAIQTKDIVKIFDALLVIATELNASDIHIEPYQNDCRMRLRVDGVMETLVIYPKHLHENIIAKFKIESGQMRPDEKRLPQDARVSTMISTQKELDLRANTLPTVHGEKLVLRIVDKSKTIPTLDQLGLEGTQKDILLRNINYPNGIILVTWPTGSGKTTTLYACLHALNKVGVNITTFEDPVEIKLNGMNQAQIRTDIWFSFAQGLRWSLRQDPDIVMVGEVRDRDTLEAAMEASMTGHLVFSTIHTNSSSETITRLTNLGAQPYMMTGTLNLIVAQRLARTIHQDHKIQINVREHAPVLYQSAVQALRTMPEQELIHELKLREIDPNAAKSFFEDGIAYIPDPTAGEKWMSWRTAIYEMLEFDDEIKEMLLVWKTALSLEKYALEQKWMVNLERDAIFKVIQWRISLDEVYRLVKHKKII